MTDRPTPVRWPRSNRLWVIVVAVLAVGIAIACLPLIPLMIPAIGFCLASLAPASRPPLRFYRLVLPLLWGVFAWIAYYHPGDEYGMLVVSLLPAAWLQLFGTVSNIREILVPCLLGGVVTMGLCGWVLDRLRVPPKLWGGVTLLLATGLLFYSLSQFASLHRATQKNGSILAYLAAATNLAIYLTTLASLVLSPPWRALRPWIWRRLQGAAVPAERA